MAASATTNDQPGRRILQLEILLIAMAAILLEISYTRIFSFKLYYYFTYLIIGIAMLGLGAGGVFAALSPRLRRADASATLAGCSLVAAALVPASYFVVALVQLNTIDFVDGVLPIARLALVCGFLFAPFLAIGVALAVIFASRPSEMNQLYFADLVGAGIGCAICIPLFSTIAPPGAVMLSGLLLALAALSGSFRRLPGVRWPALLLAVGLLVSLLDPSRLVDPVVDRTKTLSPQLRQGREVLFTRWNALFRIDVMPAKTRESNIYFIIHDGMVGSALHRFDGNYAGVNRFQTDIRSKPFSILKSRPKVLIIGAAGGHEILASLHFGASAVTAVELNPVTVSLVKDRFADFVGHIADDPRVDLINAEGRSFLQRDPEKYDLIWFVAPDSYASMNAASSGAFVLSESYLFTTEMIQESLSHLNPGGVVCVQWGEAFPEKNRTVRYIATARHAFEQRGVEPFSDHVLVSTAPGFLPTSTIILRNEPFEPAEVARYAAKTRAVPRSKLWHPRAGAAAGDSHALLEPIRLSDSELAAWFEEYPYAVTPITDDAPFFWHFTRFRDAFSRPWRADKDAPAWELATGEQTLMVLLAVAVCFAAVFLLLPLWSARDVWSRVPNKRHAFLYFAGIGLGFMFFEVCLIQKLTLFLGYPTYSLTVTLFSLLIFAGIGSLLSDRYSGAAGRNAALWALFGVVALLTVLYLVGLPLISAGLGGLALGVRIVIAVLVLAPLGLSLGAFMPIGVNAIARLSPHAREYVAWAWAVNGFFSVVSSVLATILAMTVGFNGVLLLALLAYAMAAASLTRAPLGAPPSAG